jgi:hypothetical protein
MTIAKLIGDETSWSWTDTAWAPLNENEDSFSPEHGFESHSINTWPAEIIGLALNDIPDFDVHPSPLPHPQIAGISCMADSNLFLATSALKHQGF